MLFFIPPNKGKKIYDGVYPKHPSEIAVFSRNRIFMTPTQAPVITKANRYINKVTKCFSRKNKAKKTRCKKKKKKNVLSSACKFRSFDLFVFPPPGGKNNADFQQHCFLILGEGMCCVTLLSPEHIACCGRGSRMSEKPMYYSDGPQIGGGKPLSLSHPQEDAHGDVVPTGPLHATVFYTCFGLIYYSPCTSTLRSYLL